MEDSAPEGPPPDQHVQPETESENRTDLQWHFLQCFGQPNAAESAPIADLLSALQFNKDGQFLATGDQGGRIVLLQQSLGAQRSQGAPAESGRWMLPMEYNYLTEFQAHQPDFDYLKSIEISEKINSISWLQGFGSSHLMLSANDKQAKLWKVFEQEAISVADYNHHGEATSNMSFGRRPPPTTLTSALDLKIPRVIGTSKTYESKCRRAYSSTTHTYFIHSVSTCSDESTFMTSDDLSIYLWDLERPNSSFGVLDIRPTVPDQNESLRVITDAAFHPTNPNLLAYSTSRSVLSIADLRHKDTSGGSAQEFQHTAAHAVQSIFFQELVMAASSFNFSPDGQYVVTRDYMFASVWDVRQPSAPLRTFQVHEHLWDRLVELYENESIFDRLGCSVSPDGRHVAVGSYCELSIFNLKSDTFTTLKSCGSPVALNDQDIRHSANSTTNFNWKVENIAWHPTQPLVVATALNSLYTYCAPALPSSDSRPIPSPSR